MQVEVVSFNISLSDGLQTITAPGLGSVVPKAVLFCLVGSDIFDDFDGNSGLGFGCVDGTRQWATYGIADDGAATMNTHTVASDSNCLLVMHDSDGSVRAEAQFDAFVAGGVRIDWIDAHFDDFKCIAIFFAGDDVTVRADNYLLGAQDVEVDITAPGFRPKMVFATTRGGGKTHTNGTDDGVEAHQRISVGAAVDNGSGYTQRSWINQNYDGTANSRVRMRYSSNRVGGRGDNTYQVELTTPDASGFSSFTRGGTPAGDWMFYLALTCDNPISVSTFSSPASTGNNAVTGIGFQPIAVLMGNSGQIATDTDQELDNGRGFGAFNSGTEEWSSSIGSENAAASASEFSVPRANAYAVMDPGTGSSYLNLASFVSMDADGFTLNHSIVDTGRKSWVLAFGPAPSGDPDDFTHLALLGVGV
ncbi:MAG TPA: hypothetical protein VMZ92_02815 [Planctomycetota bacterium]|nr:hypothetical protein [Planctomycetota bacterium]